MTLIYMALPAYLLVGCILMLIANELVHGAITRTEFLKGMLVWPIAIVYFLEHLFSALLQRLSG